MGNFHLSIRGVGPHHNKQPYDANEQGRRFTLYMQAAGHAISGAEVTTGGADNVVPALYATAAPELRESIVDGAAREAFNAYNAAGPNPGKTWDGKDVPAWQDCGDQVRAKWRAAARALMGLVPLLLVLFGLPAFAQDGAAEALPMTGGELATGGGLAALLAVLFPLGRQLFAWLRAQTASVELRRSLETVEAYLSSAVAPRVQAALANDGRIDEREKAQILSGAVSDLPGPLMTVLRGHFGNAFQTWLEGLLLRLLTDGVRKEAEAARKAAEAKVVDVDSAIAAEKARRAALAGGAP